MKKQSPLLITAITLLLCCCFTLAKAHDTWHCYMAYHDITDVQQGGKKLYVLASRNLYSYNQNDHSITTYDKVNGLSDVNISFIRWCEDARKLVVIYSNQNIDLISDNGDITNVADYYMKSLAEDKTVNHIYINGNYAYISTGFGILKLNVKDAEIADTYNLGFKVAYSYIENGYLYAASPEKGIYRASLSSNMLDSANWTRTADYVAHSESVDPELLATAQTFNPGGPKYNYFGFMRYMNNQLYSCGGGYTAAIDHNRPGTVQIWNGTDWIIYQDDFVAEKTPYVNYVDIMALDIDPRNHDHVFASGRTGVYEFMNGTFQKHHTWNNSTLSSVFNTSYDYVVIEGMKFDAEGNLWCMVNMAIANGIACYTKNSEWTSKDNPLLKDDVGNMDHMQNAITDSRGLIWLTNNTWVQPAIIIFQPDTEGMNVIKSFVNQDGTTVNVSGGVKAVAEDINGDMWVATNVGPLLLPANEIASTSPVFTQIKVPRNDGTNYADYLLNGVDITSIVIDGGNRKWFGTNGQGLYLIGEDNQTEVKHYTQNNSPLLSNYIESLAYDGKTGELYIGTDQGLCSLLTDATSPVETMTDNTVYAYPNPVHPDYNGMITITGLSFQSDVKITTASGVLVAEGKSTGGTFQWDGCDMRGKRVASGVYMVQTATQKGKKGTVCKIAVVR